MPLKDKVKRAEYEKALADADVFVSTANHEFFGISAVEAGLAGAYPILPKRLAYPEILATGEQEQMKDFFYDGTVPALADKLAQLAGRAEKDCLWAEDPGRVSKVLQRYKWPSLGGVLDEAAAKTVC